MTNPTEAARRYRKKPVVIEAWQFNGEDGMSWPRWMHDYNHHGLVIYWSDSTLGIPTLEGMMRAMPGDYIVKGVKGEVYPCKPDIFKMTYEAVADD